MALEHVSLAQALGIWSDLVEAYHGVNGYGGRVAEIYAYRLQEYNPTAHALTESHLKEEALSELAVAAARRLQFLVRMFCERYEDARVRIDGVRWDRWHGPLDHRCHVEVRRRAGCRT